MVTRSETGQCLRSDWISSTLHPWGVGTFSKSNGRRSPMRPGRARREVQRDGSIIGRTVSFYKFDEKALKLQWVNPAGSWFRIPFLRHRVCSTRSPAHARSAPASRRMKPSDGGRLALRSRETDNYNGQRIAHQPASRRQLTCFEQRQQNRPLKIVTVRRDREDDPDEPSRATSRPTPRIGTPGAPCHHQRSAQGAYRCQPRRREAASFQFIFGATSNP